MQIAFSFGLRLCAEVNFIKRGRRNHVLRRLSYNYRTAGKKHIEKHASESGNAEPREIFRRFFGQYETEDIVCVVYERTLRCRSCVSALDETEHRLASIETAQRRRYSRLPPRGQTDPLRYRKPVRQRSADDGSQTIRKKRGVKYVSTCIRRFCGTGQIALYSYFSVI